MKKHTLKCKVTTPIFCYGADGETPDLRVPSLKGALRFWWRAVHPDLSLPELRRKESEIFGGAGDNESIKSSFSMQITNLRRTTKKIQALPHKNNSKFKKKATMVNTTFDIIIRPKNKEIIKLLRLTSILGGIGARSRRGYGCFQIELIDEKEIKLNLDQERIIHLIKEINPNFDLGNIYTRKYPYLQKVEIGKPIDSYDELLKIIGRASHNFDTPYTGTTDKSIAHSSRYASPIYVSVYQQNEQYYPIISTLKRTLRVANNHREEEKNKNNFIKAILGGE